MGSVITWKNRDIVMTASKDAVVPNALPKLQIRSQQMTIWQGGTYARSLEGSINNSIQIDEKDTLLGYTIVPMQTAKKEDLPKASCLSHQKVVRVITEDITSLC